MQNVLTATKILAIVGVSVAAFTLGESNTDWSAPLVIPDSITMDSTLPAGFANGRKLEDQVIDITLSLVLLDQTAPGQDLTTLIGTNPTANDVAFDAAFPYLAAPH